MNKRTKAIKPGHRVGISRIRAVSAKTGLPISSIYEKLGADPTFPNPINLGPRSIGFVDEEIDEWIESRIRARDRKLQHSPVQTSFNFTDDETNEGA